MPRHALTERTSKEPTQVLILNGLPYSVVGESYDNGHQSFKSRVPHHPISTVAEAGFMTSF